MPVPVLAQSDDVAVSSIPPLPLVESVKVLMFATMSESELFVLALSRATLM